MQLWVQPAVQTPSQPSVRGQGLLGRLRVSCVQERPGEYETKKGAVQGGRGEIGEGNSLVLPLT